MRLLDFAEKRAEELMKFHLEDMAIINREAHVTFTFSIGVLSVAFGYLIQLYEHRTDLAHQNWTWLAPITVLNIHLGYCVWRTLTKTMTVREVKPLGNEPKNLLKDELWQADFDGVRYGELLNLQDRITFNRERNAKTGAQLNIVRRLLMISPLIFLAAWILTAGLVGWVRA